MATEPLANKIRPESFDDMVGQSHLFGVNGTIRKMCERHYLPNMIFFGPPGTGKTTAANIIAAQSGMTLHKLNATTASIDDIRAVIRDTGSLMGQNGVLLYLDEIQYFNKKQQQTLLEFIEDGRITLIASTTENPYLYVYNAIISRSAVFEFKSVTEEEIVPALNRALAILNRETGLEKTITEEALHYIAASAAGDVRRSINLLENTYYAGGDELTKETAGGFLPKVVGNFDRAGTVHYDMLSALQKSVRGSDPDAAIFYLAKILEGGDLLGACRRLQAMASEDIGQAYPMAPAIVYACVQSAKELGLPEASLPLSHAVIMLAAAPKSNSAHVAYERAAADIRAGKGQNVPDYMRPTHRYQDYKYPHDYPDHWVEQRYLPTDLGEVSYYEFGENKTEQAAKAYWDKIKTKK